MTRLTIDITDQAWDTLLTHAASRRDIEVGGVLLGVGDASGVRVETALPALAARGGSTHVTFTADTWAEIHRAIDERFAGMTIVGWYHTHPGFGVFLSEMDLFIHRSFFDLPFQLAVVVDPLAGERGVFAWHGGRIARVEVVPGLNEQRNSLWMVRRLAAVGWTIAVWAVMMLGLKGLDALSR
jgi:proteasome lid subunit RPN8/RPN11